MKLGDMIVSAFIKRGVLYDARNVELEIPVASDKEALTIKVKIDHMTLKVDKEDKF